MTARRKKAGRRWRRSSTRFLLPGSTGWGRCRILPSRACSTASTLRACSGTGAAIDVHLEQAARTPSELSLMHLYPIDGAVHRVRSGDTAWNCRDATWSMVIAGIDPNPQKAGPVTRWTKAYWEAVHPFDLGGAYPNFMMADEGDARIKATYGDNYPRLAALKNTYDPANLFRVNQNIRLAV